MTTHASGIEGLLSKARALGGKTVGEIADALAVDTRGEAVRTKGTPGAILERALGATGGSSKVVDFPDLGVELKTIPVDERGAPAESTYVCTLSLADAETQEWESSWVRAKLARVLFVPLVGQGDVAWTERRVGAPVLWSPTPSQEDVLRGDFDDVVGLIGIGRIEDLTAHRGRWLQVRPKARDGSVRTVAWGAGNEAIETVPRGFYLRTRFTRAILVDPAAMPE
ncbi:MAG: DNA mismatch repair endonuclease MutH [Deltaproteobacteria bacterium]|nr:DNA mismatch repair endonuclease MutH [Deltaproteobacteria bacterium]